MSDTQVKINQLLLEKINSNKETIKAFELNIKKIENENKKLLKVIKEIENIFLDVEIKEKKECNECKRTTNISHICENDYCINYR